MNLTRPEKLPLDFWAHQDWLDHYSFAEQLTDISTNGDYNDIRDTWETLPEETRNWMLGTLLNGKIQMLSSNAFILPVFSPVACEWILERSKLYNYEENVEGELEEYRIPEVQLQTSDPLFFQHVGLALSHFLSPWFAMIWNAQPNIINTIQLAKYNPAERVKGNWHIDRDSDFTAVISLNPGGFTGGGTEIADGPFSSVTIPPLPQGWALIFDGKRTYHQGLPVESGDRDLLVVWAEKDVKDEQ
jgi:hypothetical protein